MNTSKLFTNTRRITNSLKPEFSYNPKHFPAFYCQKKGLQWCGYLSYESVKYSFDITLLRWKALLLLLLLHDFHTTAWFLKGGNSHSVTVLIFMRYIGAPNVYVDTQPRLEMHKTYICCVSTGILASLPSRSFHQFQRISKRSF